MSTLEMMRKMMASRQQGGGNRVRGIFHTFEDNDNIIRLAGNPLEVRTHFIAPAPKRSDKGLCAQVAFTGDTKLQQTINCPDWDIDKQEFKKEKTCPVCKLRTIAHQVLKHPDLSAEEKKYYDELAQKCSSVRKLKWNIIDRKDPYVISSENGKEVKVLGYKIATIGMEALNDILGIFEQCAPMDITDADEGIDICVVKGNNGVRTAYSAKAVIEGRSLKVTPLSPEERAMPLHDLKAINGKPVDPTKVVDAFHEEYRTIYDTAKAGASTEETAEIEEDAIPAKAVAPKAAPTVAAPIAKPAGLPQRPVAKAPVAAAKPVTAEPSVSEAIESALGDDDALLGETPAQKKT